MNRGLENILNEKLRAVFLPLFINRRHRLTRLCRLESVVLGAVRSSSLPLFRPDCLTAADSSSRAKLVVWRQSSSRLFFTPNLEKHAAWKNQPLPAHPSLTPLDVIPFEMLVMKVTLTHWQGSRSCLLDSLRVILRPQIQHIFRVCLQLQSFVPDSDL